MSPVDRQDWNATLQKLSTSIAGLKGSDEQHVAIGDLIVDLREAIFKAIREEGEAEALRQTDQIEALAAEIHSLRQPRRRSGSRAPDPDAGERHARAAALIGRRVRHRRTGLIGKAIRLDTSPSNVQVDWDDADWGVARGEDLEVVEGVLDVSR